MRTFIIGDIHGCYNELNKLIEKFDPAPEDKIYTVGDVISRGPESGKCIELLKELKVESVMGNHEHWYLQTHPFDNNSITSFNFRKLGIEEHIEWIISLPYYLIFDNFIIVHGGFDPGIAFKDNSHENLVSLRVLEHTSKPWFDGYYGTKHIYFGHWAKLGLFFSKNVTCLDSGCVYGGKLSGYIIEENRLLQIEAEKTYHNVFDEKLQ